MNFRTFDTKPLPLLIFRDLDGDNDLLVARVYLPDGTIASTSGTWAKTNKPIQDYIQHLTDEEANRIAGSITQMAYPNLWGAKPEQT